MALHIGFQSVPYSQSSSPGWAHEAPLLGAAAGQVGTSEPVGPEASAIDTKPVELPPSEVAIDVQASGSSDKIAAHLKSTRRG